MSNLERAKNAIYELYNVAEHVGRLSDAANRDIQRGDVARARECLEQATRSADLFEMRWRDARAALEVLAAE